MQKNILVGTGAIGLLVISYILLSNQSDSEPIVANSPAATTTPTTPLGGSSNQNNTVADVDEVFQTPEGIMTDGTSSDTTTITTDAPEVAIPSTGGSFDTYSVDKLSRAETGDVVIFFHASWCPSCRTLSADIEENRLAIPPNTTILKADYDSETELKRKYGVTTQHTLIQVDQNGTLIKKWSGGSTLASVVAQIE